MAVTRTNVDFAKRILAERVGNPYVYGGNWSPINVRAGTDCSGLVIDICDAVRNGTGMAWSRHGMSTESWRPIEVGETGTIFRTICVASPYDFPPDAAVKIALHHGPGGGVNSHMWCEVDGMRGESNGTDGCVTGLRARNVYDTSYANDWHYLPGPITPTDTGDFMATDQRFESLSMYATPGEGPIYTLARLLQNVDAMRHQDTVESAARLGDRDALDRVARVASGQGRYRDQGSINHARAVLADIEANQPEVLRTYLAGR